MNLNELKTKYNLNEGHLLLLFDVLYLYHEYDLLYSFEELELFFNVTRYTKKRDSYYLKSFTDLIKREVIEFVNDKEAKFFIVSEEIRGIELFKEIEKEVC
ncbi:hypothetical protein ACF5W4_07495 [Bacillota bacterium Lsc_1132]